MLHFYLKLSLWTLLWCGVGVALLFALMSIGVISGDSSYKGAVVFVVALFGALMTASRLRSGAVRPRPGGTAPPRRHGPV